GGMCGPVFNSFMSEAIKQMGSGKFAVPPGGTFIKIDRFTGARLNGDASGDNVVAEYFREGEEPIFGLAFDGGFEVSGNLPMFSRGETEENKQVQTSTGRTVTVAPQASFGTLSSGGLY
ncbi:MAG: penicillin-binding protein, partial [Planktomarina sp.]